MIVTEGIVLKERISGESDKFIDVLTKDMGIIEISVRAARKINGKSGSATQLFAYSKFCINQRRDCFGLNSAEPIHIFYGLRSSLTGIALASYFADVIRFCCVEEKSHNSDVLRLFLNTLHFLEKNLRSEQQLKSIFEFRLMTEIGYMPDVVACRVCGMYEPEEPVFVVGDGSIYCHECYGGIKDESNSGFFKIRLPVLNAVRHIVFADFDRLFNFRVSDEVMQQLSVISESYITAHLERSFGTLEFYKSITGR
jgi:DNA repair protein RecO (recombination protein O)